MDEAVADPAPDRSKRARMRPGQGRMVGANIAVAGISVGLVSPCQRDHSAHHQCLDDPSGRICRATADDDVTGLQPGTFRWAADALSMKLREGGRVVLVDVLMDGLSDKLPAVAERFQRARSDILAFTA